MSQSKTGRQPDEIQVERKIAAAKFQIELLQEISTSSNQRSGAAAESYACAAIHQMLQALTAALQRVNLTMPDPLPERRVSLRNLRDRFHSVQVESDALRSIEAVSRPGQGWLWWLKQKEAGSAFAPVLQDAGDAPGQAGIWRDPINHQQGPESQTPVDYLNACVERMEDLIRQVIAQTPSDVARYREALGQATRRLM